MLLTSDFGLVAISHSKQSVPSRSCQDMLLNFCYACFKTEGIFAEGLHPLYGFLVYSLVGEDTLPSCPPRFIRLTSNTSCANSECHLACSKARFRNLDPRSACLTLNPPRHAQ